MLKFESKNFFELQSEVDYRKNEISVDIIKEICAAIENNVDTVKLNIETSLDIEVVVEKDKYIDALKINIERASMMGEYELCAKAKKYIERGLL